MVEGMSESTCLQCKGAAVVSPDDACPACAWLLAQEPFAGLARFLAETAGATGVIVASHETPMDAAGDNDRRGE